MKGILGSPFALLVSSLATLAQTAPSSMRDTELPSCALTCLDMAIENTTYGAVSQTCFCTNLLQLEVTDCVAASCSIKDSLVTRNVTATACDYPVRDKGNLYSDLSTILGSISGAVVVLRFVSKFVSGATLWLDDYLLGLMLLSGVASSVLIVHGMTSNGFGKDIWTVTFKQITDFLRTFYTIEILYFFQVALLKLSILFFYLRVFPGTRIRLLIWGTIILDILYGIIFVFFALFQCSPVDYYWKQWDGEHRGRCFNVNAIGWANVAISIVLDFWMIGLPVSQLVKLSLCWKKKVGVGLMFGVGAFVTIVSIFRLHSLTQFADSTNPTWDNFATAQWSTIELNVGIICACMPSIRVLLVHLSPKMFGTSQSSNNGYFVHDSGNQRPHRILDNGSKSNILHSPRSTIGRGTSLLHDETDVVLNDLEILSSDLTDQPGILVTKHSESPPSRHLSV